MSWLSDKGLVIGASIFFINTKNTWTKLAFKKCDTILSAVKLFIRFIFKDGFMVGNQGW